MDDPTPPGETVFLRPEPSGGLSYTFLGTSKTENGIPTYSMLRAGTTIYAVGDNVLVNCGNLEHPWIAKILLFYRDASGNMCVFGWRRGGGGRGRLWRGEDGPRGDRGRGGGDVLARQGASLALSVSWSDAVGGCMGGGPPRDCSRRRVGHTVAGCACLVAPPCRRGTDTLCVRLFWSWYAAFDRSSARHTVPCATVSPLIRVDSLLSLTPLSQQGVRVVLVLQAARHPQRGTQAPFGPGQDGWGAVLLHPPGREQGADVDGPLQGV